MGAVLNCFPLSEAVEELMRGGIGPCEAMRLVGHCAAVRILRRLGVEPPEGLLSAAITPPGGGSSLRSPGVEAVEAGEGGYRLRGEKVFATNGLDADKILVYAGLRGEPALFLVEAGAPGLRKEPMGLAAYECSGIARLVFNDTPAELAAQGREARRAVVAGLGENRVLVAALALGLARRGLRLATGWALDRGVLRYQAVAHRLARALTLLEAAQALVRREASQVEEGAAGLAGPSMAKYFAVEAAVEAVRAARLTLGGYAYARGGAGEELRRLQLHVEALEPAEGTQDIQLEIVARELAARLAGEG